MGGRSLTPSGRLPMAMATESSLVLTMAMDSSLDTVLLETVGTLAMEAMEAMEVMEFMARLRLRPRLRPSPTPLDRLLMASLLPMPMLPGTLTMLDIPDTSPMAMAAMAIEDMEDMDFMASVRPRLRPSPTPSDRWLMAFPSPMPMPLATPITLATPASSPLATAMEAMEAMELMESTASVRLRPMPTTVLSPP